MRQPGHAGAAAAKQHPVSGSSMTSWDWRWVGLAAEEHAPICMHELTFP